MGSEVKVEHSSNVAAYERIGNDVIITFKNGGRYQYKDVPMEVFAGLIKAESIGSYVSKNLRGKYETKKLEE